MENSNTEQNSTDQRGGSCFGAALNHTERAATSTMERTKEAAATGIEDAERTLHKTKDAVDAGLRTAQQRVGESVDIVKEAATNAAQNVSDAASYVGTRAEAATSSLGGAMESTGHYLKEDGLHHIVADVSELIRRNPVPAMLIGIGLGVLLASATARRSA